MKRNILLGIVVLSLVVMGFSSCAQTTSADDPGLVLISEKGFKAVNNNDLVKAIDQVKGHNEIKGILKDRVDILVNYIHKMDAKLLEERKPIDDYLYVRGIRSKFRFTNLYFVARDNDKNTYRVIFKKIDEKVYLLVIG